MELIGEDEFVLLNEGVELGEVSVEVEDEDCKRAVEVDACFFEGGILELMGWGHEWIGRIRMTRFGGK